MGPMLLPRSVALTPAQEELLGHPGALRVSRIWPRGPHRLSLELVDDNGVLRAGQWIADPEDLERITRGTRDRAVRPELVLLCPSTDDEGRATGTILLQGQGADRRLRALPHLLAEPGTTLMVHRPERRAVVHRAVGGRAVGRAVVGRSGPPAVLAPAPATEYVRVFRPGRTEPVVSAAQRGVEVLAGLPGLTAPAVVAHRPEEGVVVTSALPGTSLRDLLGPGAALPEAAVPEAAVPEAALPEAALPEAARAGATGIGRLLGHLGRTPAIEGLPVRDAESEITWVQVWLDRLAGYRPEVHARVAPVLAIVAGDLRATTAGPLGLVHGDLHDGQVLVDEAGGLAVLDWDTLAVGEDALDAGNVWAHADLRQILGQWSPAAAAAAWAAVLDGWDPDPGRLARAGTYRRLLLLRLACQYAFRPPHEAAVGALAARAADADPPSGT